MLPMKPDKDILEAPDGWDDEANACTPAGLSVFTFKGRKQLGIQASSKQISAINMSEWGAPVRAIAHANHAAPEAEESQGSDHHIKKTCLKYLCTPEELVHEASMWTTPARKIRLCALQRAGCQGSGLGFL